MGIGQVGDGEQAALGVAGVAVRAQLLMPVPDVLAQRGAVAEGVAQSQFGVAMERDQRLFPFDVDRMVQATREAGDGLARVQFAAPCVVRRQHGIVAMALAIGGGQSGQLVSFGGRVALGERAGAGVDQRRQHLAARAVDSAAQGLLELGQRGEGAFVQRPGRDPGRAQVQSGQHAGGVVGGRGVESG